MAPHFETLDAIEGGCPDGWDEEAEYEQGDLVAVVISDGFEDTSERTRKPSRQPITPTPPPTSQYCFSPISSPSKRPTKFPVCDVCLSNSDEIFDVFVSNNTCSPLFLFRHLLRSPRNRRRLHLLVLHRVLQVQHRLPSLHLKRPRVVQFHRHLRQQMHLPNLRHKM